jgi:hypothetical protein
MAEVELQGAIRRVTAGNMRIAVADPVEALTAREHNVSFA